MIFQCGRYAAVLCLWKKQTVEKELLNKWKRQISLFDPWKLYNAGAESPCSAVGNRGLFAAVSEFKAAGC